MWLKICKALVVTRYVLLLLPQSLVLGLFILIFGICAIIHQQRVAMLQGFMRFINSADSSSCMFRSNVSVNSKRYHPPRQILGKGQISGPRANILVKCPAPEQIFWSNALPPGNFQRSNPRGPGRFSIFLLLMNNSLSLRFRMKMLSSCNGKEAYSKKETRVLNQTDCL